MAQVYTSNVVVKPFAVGLAQPVDVRTIVSTLADLVKKDTFNSIQKICAGMPIAVVESGKSGLWMLPDATAYSTLQNAMLQSTWADPTEVTEEVVLSKGWVKLQTSAEVDAKLSELAGTIGESVSGISTDVEALKLIVNGEVGEDGTVIKASLQSQIEALDTKIDELEAADIAYTREGKNYSDVAGAISDLYAGLASAGTQEGINDLTNRVGTAEGKITALENTVNGVGETPSLQSQITANANAIAALNGKVTYKIVESLPTENIDTNVFYLVLDSEAEEDGETFYKEYLYVNNKWELVGTTHTSLSGYATESYVTEEIGKATTAANGYTDEQIEAALETAQGYANTAEGNAKTYAEGQAAQALADAKADTQAQIQALNLGTTYETIANVDLVRQDVADVEELAGENAERVQALEDTVNGKDGVVGLTTRVGALEDYKTTHDGLYNSLNQLVSKNTGDIATINNNLGSYLTKADAEATYETIENVAALTKTVGDNKTAAETGIKEAKDLAQEAKDGLADKVTNSSLATTLANYQTQDLTITDFDTEGVQATVESALLANKNAMAANATAISGLSGRMDAVEALAGDAATKASVEALAGETGRVTVVEGKVSTLEGVVGDASKGLVKDVADLSANKADAATVESTYLKKSGDTSLELGVDSDEENVAGDLIVHGEVGSFYTRLSGGDVFAQSDNGSTRIDGGKITIHAPGFGDSFVVEAYGGISGNLVDTAIPSTPADGHIATTGAIKTYVDGQVQIVKDSVASAYTFKGPKTYEEILATTDAKAGDVYNCTTEVTLSGVKYPVGTNFAWDGAAWEPLSGIIDISAYATTASVTEALEAQAESFQGVIEGVEGEVEKKAAIDGSNLGTLSDTAKASWKSALGFATAADQVQADWVEDDPSSKAYIAHKPAISMASRNGVKGVQIGDEFSAQNIVQYDTNDGDAEYYGINRTYHGICAGSRAPIAVEICDQGFDICFTVTAHYTSWGKVRYEIIENTDYSTDITTWEVSKEVLHNVGGSRTQIPNLEITADEEDDYIRYIKFPGACVYEIQIMFVAA
jgi:hypothetical protein